MDFQESFFGLAFLGLVAFVTSLAVIFFAYRINRHRLNWYEKNLLETQYLEISPNDLNKTDDSEECNSLWMKGKLKLQKAFSKSSSDSLDVLERSSTSTSNVAPLVGNNDMIIIASNNSLDEIISTKSFPDAEDTAHNDPFINDVVETDIKGTIHLILTYDKQAEILTVRIVEAQDLLARDFTGTADPYVKIRLLPDQLNIWQTKIHRKTINPIFDEDFVFEVTKDSLNTSELEVVVLDANKRHQSLGAIRLPLSSLEKKEKFETWEKLRGVQENLARDNGNGELLVSLNYLSTTECLTVTILKGRNLRSADSTRATSDPYVKVTFSCRDRRLKKCKTRIRRNTLSPTFNESFVFNINRERLKRGSLQFDVLHDNLIGVDEPLGSCVLGKKKLDNGKTRNTLVEMLLTKNASGQWLSLDSA